jgi:signal transduction histidine kinase
MRTEIEPGVISIFRGFAGVMFVLLSLGLCSIERQPLTTQRIQLFTLASVGILFAYLSVRSLERILGTRYFPIALLLGTAFPILVQAYSDDLLRRGVLADPSQADPVRLYSWLIPPALLVAVQYRSRTVLLYSLVTALVPLCIAIGFGTGDDHINLHGTHAAGRAFFFALSGLIVVRISNAQRRTRLELAQKNLQLLNYATTLERLTVSRERNRLARELHDTLAHTLSAINVQLKALDAVLERDPEAARRILAQTQDLSRMGLQESRRALHALRASPLDELGLLLALRRLAELASERAGLQLDCDLPASLPELAPEIEQTMYRIAEEALNNVVRHAHASKLTVALRVESVRLQLRIADNGIGFEQGSVNGRYGIVGMKERAALVNAELHITSSPGHGTILDLSLDTLKIF